ncbi:hypothetical protein PINS_up005268 [Pythium insidiosum]|nr:hypothetical protein PINS_up005268 [Pythium insidiosum]
MSPSMTSDRSTRRMRWLVPALATLFLARCLAVARHAPALVVLHPQNHSSHAVDDDALTVRGFELELELRVTRDEEDGRDGAVELRSEKLGTIRHALAHERERERIVVEGIEPGTHLWTLQLVHTNGTRVGSADPVVLHLEFVVPQQQHEQQQQQQQQQQLQPESGKCEWDEDVVALRADARRPRAASALQLAVASGASPLATQATAAVLRVVDHRTVRRAEEDVAAGARSAAHAPRQRRRRVALGAPRQSV